jgi:hypothetical protein
MPELSLLIVAILLDTARFENQRWIRARMRGFRGASAGFGLFIDFSGLVGTIFYYTFLAGFFYDTNFKTTLCLYVILFVIGLISSMFFTRLFKGDNVIVWFIGTLAIWPLSVLLSTKVSWFGLLSSYN